MIREHGGDRAGYRIAYGTEPMDFSANVSPLGMPEGVRRAVTEALSDSAWYPDRDCRELRTALAEHLHVPQDRILCGNGASDLIWRLVSVKKPQTALVTSPSFSEYEAALQSLGCSVRHFALRPENGFRVDEEILDGITADLDMLFLCQPNNPTGVTVSQDLLLRILSRCDGTGTLLVTDECFSDFLDEPEKHTLLPYLPGHRLVILRAFTKFWGMAGLRLGYCLSDDADLLSKMQAAGPPWNVSSVAQAAGIAALKEEDYAKELRALIREERSVMREELEKLGLSVIPGEANFLLFRSGTPLADALKDRGILIRCCADFTGLGEDWFRVAVRTKEENGALISALREVLA